MTTTLERLQAAVAALPVTPRVAPSADQIGYGIDLSCITDVTHTLDEVDPQSNTAIGEAIIRRYITPRGTLPDDQDYGLDLRGYCNRGVTDAELRTLPSAMRMEAMKDDRLEDAGITVTWDSTTRRLRATAVLRPRDSVDPFRLVFFVSGDGAELIESIGQ